MKKVKVFLGVMTVDDEIDVLGEAIVEFKKAIKAAKEHTAMLQTELQDAINRQKELIREKEEHE